jgi:hypothetical protein
MKAGYAFMPKKSAYPNGKTAFAMGILGQRGEASICADPRYHLRSTRRTADARLILGAKREIPH